MSKIVIFSNSIIIEKKENKNINNLILKELYNHKKNNKGRSVSNMGGFQSKGDNLIVSKFLLNTSIKYLNNHYSLQQIKINLVEYWINENLKNNYNAFHLHPECHFSGVYYINVPKNSGNIKFKRNDLTFEYTNLYRYFQNTDSFTTYTVVPENNLLLLFPSNLYHCVESNLSNEPRISVAFNLRLS